MDEPHVANPQMASTMSLVNHVNGLVGDMLQIAIVIFNCMVDDPTLWAMTSPLSSCRLGALVILDDNHEEPAEASAAWLQRNRIAAPESVKVMHGEAGFDKMLLDESMQAVYVLLTGECRHKHVICALEAAKHVLLYDPVQTSHSAYAKKLAIARRVKRYFQFSSTFVHHNRVQAFLDFVLDDRRFGKIESIKTTLRVNNNELALLGVKSPDHSMEGILRLARPSILITALMLSRAGPCHPVSAKVNHISKPGESLNGQGTVTFSNGAKLTWKAAATTAPTRQVLEVQEARQYASITDFVIPHPDGLATYRVYDQTVNPVTGKFEVNYGESLDIPSGVPHDIMMWRKFSANCRAIAEKGWTSGPAVASAQERTLISLQTQSVMAALAESVQSSFSEIAVQPEDE